MKKYICLFLTLLLFLTSCADRSASENEPKASEVPSTTVSISDQEILTAISETMKRVTDPMIDDALKELEVEDYTLTGWSADYYDPSIQEEAAIAPAEGAPTALYLLTYRYQLPDGSENEYGFILQFDGVQYICLASGEDFTVSEQAQYFPLAQN